MEAQGKRYIWHGSRSTEFTIWNLSDIHWGNRGCAVDRLKADIERIRTDPCAFWLGGGDNAEYIGLTDRRFDPDAVAEDLKVRDMGQLGKRLIEEVGNLFRPIRDKCLGLLLGNHEKHYQQAMQQSHLHAWLCCELDVPNLEYSALFDVVFVRTPQARKPILKAASPPGGKYPRHTFRVFVHHGAGYAQTPGGKLNRLVQFMDSFDADIYMVGHVHDRVGKRIAQIGADPACTKIIERERLGVISGSYLRSYAQGVTTYAEQRGYRPVTLGASFARIKPATREMRGEV